MITDTTRAIAEMMDGMSKMTGAPPHAVISVAEHAVKRVGLSGDTVDEAIRYLNAKDRV